MFAIVGIIHGSDQIFSVELEETEIGDKLKQLIKETEEARVAGVDDAQIDLYRIDVQTNSDNNASIAQVRLKEKDLSTLQKLNPDLPLSEVLLPLRPTSARRSQ